MFSALVQSQKPLKQQRGSLSLFPRAGLLQVWEDGSQPELSKKKTLAVWTSLWISLPCKSSAEEKSIFAVSSQQLLPTICFQPSLREAVAKCSNILDTSIQREVQLRWHVFINVVCADYLQVLTFSSYPCLIFPSINSSRSCSLLFSKRHFILSHISSGTVVLQFLLAHLHKHKGTVTANGTPIT